MQSQVCLPTIINGMVVIARHLNLFFTLVNLKTNSSFAWPSSCICALVQCAVWKNKSESGESSSLFLSQCNLASLQMLRGFKTFLRCASSSHFHCLRKILNYARLRAVEVMPCLNFPST